MSEYSNWQPIDNKCWQKRLFAMMVCAVLTTGSLSAQELLPPMPPSLDVPSIDSSATDTWLPEPMYESIPHPLQVDALELIKRMDEFNHEMDESNTELNTHLDRLEDLLRQLKESQEEPEEAVAPPDIDPPPMPEEMADDSDTQTLPTEAPVPEANSEKDDDARSSIWEDDVVLSTITVTENAINRQALANNLYAAGEIKIALKIYNQLRLEADPKNQPWVIYQIGHCNRRLDNRPESDQAFRIVAAMPNGGRWSRYARWWLNNSDGLESIDMKTIQLTNSLGRLRSLVDDAETN